MIATTTIVDISRGGNTCVVGYPLEFVSIDSSFRISVVCPCNIVMHESMTSSTSTNITYNLDHHFVYKVELTNTFSIFQYI